MPITLRMRHFVGFFITAAIVAGAGCSVENQATPRLSGPSEFGLSITMTASPEQLPRDGSSQSLVTVTVRDEAGRPVSGQRLSVASNVGRVSQSEITTNSEGRSTFTFVAPDASVSGNTALINVVPLGANFENAMPRTLTISLTGRAGVTSTTLPTPSFTFSPAAPTLGENVVFDASATTDEGARCLDACTYSWDFGGEATASGRVVNYRFQAMRAYPVRLTVTDAAGFSASLTQNVTVTRGSLPTAEFAFSPEDPGQFETVHFTAAESEAAAGRTITGYHWNFGDGSTATGVTASHAYNVLGTYVVTLTVTDSAGLTASTSESVDVVNGVTAAWTSTDQPGSLAVIFNAEESRGSSSGFGGRNPITKYIWHFGDSTSVVEATTPIVSHTFPAAGTYTVTLTVEDSAGRRNVAVGRAVTVSATN